MKRLYWNLGTPHTWQTFWINKLVLEPTVSGVGYTKGQIVMMSCNDAWGRELSIGSVLTSEDMLRSCDTNIDIDRSGLITGAQMNGSLGARIRGCRKSVVSGREVMGIPGQTCCKFHALGVWVGYGFCSQNKNHSDTSCWKYRRLKQYWSLRYIAWRA